MLHTTGGRAGRLAAAALVAVIAAREARAVTSNITKGSLTIKLTTTATINTGTDGTPQDLVTAPGDSSRMFIATRNGVIRTLSSGGTLGSTPFLNLGTVLGDLYTGGEGGFLGMAFSPNFASDGKFFT